MHRETAMTPARILIRPTEARFQDAARRWQGCASVEVTRCGRIFVSLVAGHAEEGAGTFIVVTVRQNGGEDFHAPEIVVVHDDPACVTGGAVLWLDPFERLWLFWTQSLGWHDGRQGVWCAICDHPDSDRLVWSSPRRIANGMMSHKPTVCANGNWLFPCCLWQDACGVQGYAVRPELRHEQFSNIYLSCDQGASISLYSHADIPNRQFDEHTVIERRDGSLWMLARTFDGIGESFSYDGGKTWTPGKKSTLDGPCSLFHIRRLHSGRLLLINHNCCGPTQTPEEITAQASPVKKWTGRSHLTAFLSEDDGATWPYSLLLDQREHVSYPDAAQGIDGTIYVCYDHRRVTQREILMACFTEEDILQGRLVNAGAKLRILVNKATGQPDVADRD